MKAKRNKKEEFGYIETRDEAGKLVAAHVYAIAKLDWRGRL